MMRTVLSPDILMFNILPRLPAKCVGRFRCVSKEWYSFLTTPHFAKMQFLHQNQDYHQNLQLLLLSTTKPYTFRTIDCETPDHKDGASRPLPFEVQVHRGYPTILGSLHGLVCIKNIWYSSDDSKHIDLILWNPLTRDYKRLSKPSSSSDDDDNWHYKCQFGLYYTTCDDDYKLLCITDDLHPNLIYIYSLKSDSWRKLDDDETTNYKMASKHYLDFVTKSSFLLDDKLYFLKEKKQIHYGEYPSYIIMMFDTKTETLREIATPTLRKELTECIGFMVVRGSIHLCFGFTDSHGTEFYTIELWRMDEDNDGDWTKVVTYPPVQRYWRPLHVMRNGDWLMFCRGHFSQRDMNKHVYLHDVICRFESTRIGPGWPCKYMETLVSPNPNRYDFD